MGDTYLVYTEIRRGNKWQCIDPYLPKIDKQTGESKMHLLTTYENGSRTAFGSTFDKIRELGRICPDDLSETLQKEFPRKHMDDPMWQSYYDEGCVVISLRALKDALPKGEDHQYHGVYHKDAIYAFEHGEINDLFEAKLDPEEWKDMPEIMRQCYQYYEWDDDWDWPKYFKTLIKYAGIRIADWMNLEYEYEEPETRLVVYRF